MSEGRKRDNGCSQRNINCGGGVDEIDVHSVTPSTISCDLVNGVPIHQLTKYCEEAGEDKKIYPISVIQAIFDARTGIRLDKVLSMCNAIYLEYEGDFEHTVSKVQGVQRRKGLIVTYRDITNTVSTIRYKSTDLSDKAWNNSDNWEGWSFDTASSDLLDMLNSIFSNIEDYPEIYDTLKNQINLVVQDVFGHINNYPAVKKIITDSTKDNLDDVLADIFANLNSYPQIKSAFDNAFGRYINNVFGHVNNYPQVVNVIKAGVANVLDNLDQHPDLKAIIENAVNSRFYFLNLLVNSLYYDPRKTFDDYIKANISKTVYDELLAAIKAGKTIVLYTAHATKSSRVVTTRIEGKDIYLQYFIRFNETETVDQIDNKPDIRPEFIIINVIINGYNNSNQYVGECIAIRYTFDSFVNYTSNKSNGVLALNADGKVGYEQLYKEEIGYKEYENNVTAATNVIDIQPGTYNYITSVFNDPTIRFNNNADPSDADAIKRVRNSGFAYKTYVDIYLNESAKVYLASGYRWADGVSINSAGRYRIELFNGFATATKIDTDQANIKILISFLNGNAYDAMLGDDNKVRLQVNYTDLHFNNVNKELVMKHIVNTNPGPNKDTTDCAGILNVAKSSFDPNTPETIFVDIASFSGIAYSYSHLGDNVYALLITT